MFFFFNCLFLHYHSVEFEVFCLSYLIYLMPTVCQNVTWPDQKGSPVTNTVLMTACVLNKSCDISGADFYMDKQWVACTQWARHWPTSVICWRKTQLQLQMDHVFHSMVRLWHFIVRQGPLIIAHVVCQHCSNTYKTKNITDLVRIMH